VSIEKKTFALFSAKALGVGDTGIEPVTSGM
jgi:hypothetical protein